MGGKPRILVNATTMVVGGGIQVGHSFVEFAAGPGGASCEFLFAVSPGIHDSLPEPLRLDARVRRFDRTPARIVTGHGARSLLRRMEREFSPDIVYTLGLPSYTKFRSPEVGRYTNPWELDPSPFAWSLLPWRDRVDVLLRSEYRLAWARRATYFETQTEAAKASIVRRVGVSADRIGVFPNSPNPLFVDANSGSAEGPADAALTVFCLAAAFWHKNLTLIPEVAACLKDEFQNDRFTFIITVPSESRIAVEIAKASRRRGVEAMVRNIGPIKLRDCVAWYHRALIVFLPTVLEVFSATYLEAMAMGRPIVTSDLDFAREVCGNAARYYDPASARAAAVAILEVATDERLRAELVERGRRQLATFPDSEAKHRMILDWLCHIVHEVRNGQSVKGAG